jgi:tRNA-dihydrouridine synthase C
LPAHEFHKYCPELATEDRTPAGTPVLVQLLGGQPEPLAENAARAVELGALGIDLNFGCPAKTVNRHDGGATLLKNPSRIFDVVTAIRRALPPEIPVSSKVRLGFSDKDFHLDIARAAYEAGSSWLTVHARTRDEGYRPPAHWDFIGRMREAVGSTMPVIANGDMWTLDDIARARNESGCRHVMLGRGLLADPFLARELKGGARGTWDEAFVWFSRFVELSLREQRGGSFASARAKQWLKSLARRFPEAARAFEAIKRLESAHEILSTVAKMGRASADETTSSSVGAPAAAERIFLNRDETNRPNESNVTNNVTEMSL